MRLTGEQTEVVKAEVVSILKGYPTSLKAVQLNSMRGALSLVESLHEYLALLARTTGRERHVPGKFRIWQLGDQAEQG